jgi:hypothetical protein
LRFQPGDADLIVQLAAQVERELISDTILRLAAIKRQVRHALGQQLARKWPDELVVIEVGIGADGVHLPPPAPRDSAGVLLRRSRLVACRLKAGIEAQSAGHRLRQRQVEGRGWIRRGRGVGRRGAASRLRKQRGGQGRRQPQRIFRNSHKKIHKFLDRL